MCLGGYPAPSGGAGRCAPVLLGAWSVEKSAFIAPFDKHDDESDGRAAACRRGPPRRGEDIGRRLFNVGGVGHSAPMLDRPAARANLADAVRQMGSPL